MHSERSDDSAQTPEPFTLVSEPEFLRMNPAERATYIEPLIAYVKSIRQTPPAEPFSLGEPAPGVDAKDA